MTTTPLALGTLHIHAFRGLQDVELANPGRFNLLVGPNNSGKTSILEAISYFCRPDDPVHWWRIGQKRLWFSSPSLLEMMLACFPKVPQWSKGIHISCDQARHGRRDVRINCSIKEMISSHPSQKPRRSAQFQWQLVPGIRPMTKYQAFGFVIETGQDIVHPDHTPMFLIPERLVDTVTHHASNSYIYDWSDLAGSPLQQEIVTIIQHLEPSVSDFQNIVHREDGSAELRAIHKTLGACSLSMFGDGFKRALAYALGLVHAKGGVLLIDEIEMAIHKSALERVYGWLRKMCEQLDVQVFATTHSLEAIEAMLGDQPSEDTVCYQLGEGGKVAKRWSGDLLWRVVKRGGLDVR